MRCLHALHTDVCNTFTIVFPQDQVLASSMQLQDFSQEECKTSHQKFHKGRCCRAWG